MENLNFKKPIILLILMVLLLQFSFPLAVEAAGIVPCGHTWKIVGGVPQNPDDPATLNVDEGEKRYERRFQHRYLQGLKRSAGSFGYELTPLILDAESI